MSTISTHVKASESATANANTSTPVYKNLVFKGGGIKGVAYTGALLTLDQAQMLNNVIRVAGTSSGATTAAFYALGATPVQMEEIIITTPFHKFMDPSGWIAGDIKRLFRDYGWFKGEMLGRWIRGNIKALTGNGLLTFSELEQLADQHPQKFKHLYVVGANLTLQSSELFCSERTPDMPIWEAVRISTAIPLLFSAVRKPDGEVLVDGSLTWNYPINLFDAPGFRNGSGKLTTDSEGIHLPGNRNGYSLNPETLGLMVETRDNESARGSRSTVRGRGIDGFSSYLKAIIGYLTDVSCSSYLTDHDWNRTIFIDALGVRSTEFDISKNMIESLLESGKQGAKVFITRKQNSQNQNTI